jgi:PAS domain S-box-containing protein
MDNDSIIKFTLDALMECVPEGITIAEAPEVRILRVSTYGKELLGKSSEKLEGILVGQHVNSWDIYENDGKTQAKNERLPLTRAVQKGEIVKDEEWVLCKADGSRIPVLCNAAPIRDRSGRIIGGIVAWRDITERVRMEEALRQSERMMKADLAAMTKLHELSSKYLKEETLEEILDQIVDTAMEISGADFGNIQILDPESSDLKIVAQRGFPNWWIEFWNSVSKGRGSCGTALERGERVIVEDIEQSPIFAGTPALEKQLEAGVRAVQSTPLISRTGKPLGMFSTHYRIPHRPDDRELRFLDLLGRQAAGIIDRIQTDKELGMAQSQLAEQLTKMQRINEELSQFSYAVTHDLKAPLRAIANYADFLYEDLADTLTGDQKDYLKGLKSAAAQGDALINDLLNFLRLGQVAPVAEAVDVPDLVDEIRSLFKLSHDVKTDVQPQWPEILSDCTLLKQILQNLIDNGIKFNRRNPKHIEIGWQGAPNDRIEIFVRDNGIGIAPEHSEKIFHIFRRLHTNREYEGTGIGLAIVQKAAQNIGGSVRVESTPGQGSTFFVNLPNSILKRRQDQGR